MDKDPLLRSVLKEKTKVLDIFDTDKKCFMQVNLKSSPPEIWIRIRFLEINRSPSLVYSLNAFIEAFMVSCTNNSVKTTNLM